MIISTGRCRNWILGSVRKRQNAPNKTSKLNTAVSSPRLAHRLGSRLYVVEGVGHDIERDQANRELCIALNGDRPDTVFNDTYIATGLVLQAAVPRHCHQRYRTKPAICSM